VGRGADAREIVCEVEPPIETNQRFRFKPGCYNGADGRAAYRVVRVKGDRLTLDRPVRLEDFPDTNGDGRPWVEIHDIGPGDAVLLPRAVFRRYD